jgi:WD40 repeat protein
MLLLGIAIAGGVLALGQRDRARRSQAAAEAQSLTSDAERVGALALGEPTLERSLLLAAAAVTLQDRPATRGDLLTILQQNPAAIRTLRLSGVPVRSFAASHDGRVLASGDERGVVRFTDLRTWKQVGATVKLPHPVAVQAIRWAPDDRTLVVGTREEKRSELYFVDVARRRYRRIGTWPGPVGPDQFLNFSFAFSPNGQRLAVALANWADDPFKPYGPVAQRFMVLDAHTGRQLWRRRYPFRRPQMAAQVLFRRDGALITSAPQGATLVWNARTGRIVRRYPFGGRPALSPDGHTLALALDSYYAGDPRAALGLLDLRTGHLRRLKGNLPSEWIDNLAFTRDGKQIVGPSWKGAHVWDIASGEVVDTYGGTGPVNSDLVIDRRGLALFTAGDGTVTAWDPAGARRVGREFPTTDDTMRCPGNLICAVGDAHSPVMAVSLGDGRTALRDPRSGRFVDILPARDGSSPAVPAFVPGGRRLATGGDAGTVTIWDVPKRAIVQRLRYREPVVWVAVSPDGTLLAVQRQSPGAQDAHVEVRSLRTGRTIYTRTTRFGAGGLAFTGDGRELVASGCCVAGSAVMSSWDARSGAQRFRRGVKQNFPAFALSPRQGTVAVGTEDGRVLWWDARTGRSLGTPTKVAPSEANQLAFSPNGRLLAVSGATVVLWDVDTRKRVGSGFPSVKAWIPGIAFEPNGRLLIFQVAATIEWPTDRPTLQRSACRIAGRDLTPQEWRDLLPNRPYRRVCPG